MSDTSQQATRTSQQRVIRKQQLSSTQVMFAVILAIALMLAVQFSSRIANERDLAAIEASLNTEIEQLRHDQTALIEQLDYVQSDAYVEAWARSEGGLVRDGMVLVVPVPSDTVRPQDDVIPAEYDHAPVQTTLPEPEPWQVWWDLFFDFPPPI